MVYFELIKSTRFVIWIIAFFVLFLLILFTLLICILIGMNFGKSRTKSEGVVKTYQYHQFNPETNKSSIGIISLRAISLHDELEGDEFRSYEYHDGNHMLISNIGMEEYQCTGSCYCEDDEQRRWTSTFLFSRKSLYYLVAALSSILAIDLAKSHFEEKCVEEYRDECSVSSIRSIVEKCKRIIFKTKVQEEEGEEPSEEMKQFICKGSCIPNIYRDNVLYDFDMPDYIFPYTEKFGCEKLALEGKIQIDFRDFYARLEEDATDEYVAQQWFMIYHMEDFCLQSSFQDVPLEDEVFECEKAKKNPRKRGEDTWPCENLWEMNDPKCVGCEHLDVVKDVANYPMCAAASRQGENPSVVCKEI